ncbi:MAG: hypothetical protein OHK0017_10110 [Patescibacteria group bacterium]
MFLGKIDTSSIIKSRLFLSFSLILIGLSIIISSIPVEALGGGFIMGSSLTGQAQSSSINLNWSSKLKKEVPVAVEQKPVNIPRDNQLDKNSKPEVDTVVQIKTVPVNSTLTISKIGLNNVKLQYSSIYKLDELYQKMRRTPIVETQLGSPICADSGNTYITGHSEPSSLADVPYAGSYIFSRLNELQVGDVIDMTNSDGVSCKYQVYAWEVLVTDTNDQVDIDEFNKAYFPSHDRPTLTIQTCKKGSATVRLLLRAEKIE